MSPLPTLSSIVPPFCVCLEPFDGFWHGRVVAAYVPSSWTDFSPSVFSTRRALFLVLTARVPRPKWTSGCSTNLARPRPTQLAEKSVFVSHLPPFPFPPATPAGTLRLAIYVEKPFFFLPRDSFRFLFLNTPHFSPDSCIHAPPSSGGLVRK